MTLAAPASPISRTKSEISVGGGLQAPSLLPAELAANEVERSVAVRMGAHVLPRAPVHAPGGPHHFAVRTEHVDLNHAIDAPRAIQLDEPECLCEDFRRTA